MSPGISAGFFVLLQAVFRRAGGLIYDLLLLSCGIRLLMFQPCLDQILICLIRSLIYYNVNDAVCPAFSAVFVTMHLGKAFFQQHCTCPAIVA